MPSFYNARHMPLTPPEYSTGFHGNNCSNMAYQAHGYGAQQYGRQDEMMYEYTGRYASAHPQAAAAMHQHSGYSSTVNMQSAGRFSDAMGVTLPPVRSLEQSVHADAYQRPPEYRQYEQRSQQKPKDEKPVGGVSAKLDYDMEEMTDFVTEKAQQLVQSSRPSHAAFRGWVNSVLCATRLPSATIVLSLHYLSVRMAKLHAKTAPDRSENAIYRMLTVALIMGSKFLDDNTFINRSWADVSGIEIRTLNHMEREWLSDISWNLHIDPTETNGFNDWLQHWKEYERNAFKRGAQSLKLSPLDTSVQHHSPAHKSFSPPTAMMGYTPMSGIDYTARGYQSSHQTPAYAPYDPWLVRRSAKDSSPGSAPHTGPTTPEYYGGPGTWAPIDNSAYSYSRRGYGFGQMSQAQQGPQAMNAPFTPFTPTYNQQNMWTGHSIHCNCGHCSRQQMPYWVGTHYNQQPVAA